jgi:hypothetical protein
MGPQRAASQVAQLVTRLCKRDKLPEAWSAGDLVRLVEQYAKLVATIHEGKPDQSPGQDIEAILERGRVGSYRDMEARARLADQVQRKRKN